PEPQRNSQQHRDQHRRGRELERRRHALEDQADRRHVEGEGFSEVSHEGVPNEDEILLGERAVETQRGGGARDLVLIGLRVDEDVDRVATAYTPVKTSRDIAARTAKLCSTRRTIWDSTGYC